MCGIAGIADLSRHHSRSALNVIGKAMAGELSHRGPDDEGIWQDPDTPLVLGHRRLSIIDLSERGAQPMSSHSGRYMIVYNGEIYNFPALKKDLEHSGLQSAGRSDTEVLLMAVEYWGLNLTLQKINGMFAFALWDRRTKMLHLVRDRFGKKPLYIGWAGDQLLFASELKAFLRSGVFKPEISRSNINAFMRFGFIPSPQCIFENVLSLPAGHYMSLDFGNLKPKDDLRSHMAPFWHHGRKLEEARLNPCADDEKTVIGNFERLLTRCVEDRMISDVPLGSFLSGGIDSATVTALMQKLSAQPVKTFTIGFQEEGFDEAGHARKVAQHLGTDHHELYLDAQEAMAIIPKLPVMYDEPFADISALPTYLVSRFARSDVTVALTGDGGDEMLGGYTRHFAGPKAWQRTRLCPMALRRLLSGFIEKIPIGRWDRLVPQKPQFGSHMYKLAAIMTLDSPEAMYERLLSAWDELPLQSTENPDLFFKDPDYRLSGLSFAEQLMYWDSLHYLPGSILTKVDRASMAVGLECRSPLLDKRIYEYVWRLPERYKIRGEEGKWLLKQVLERHLPPDLFKRPKQGFNMPVGSWLRGTLKDWAEDLLDEQKLQSQGYFNPGVIRHVWQEHLEGRGHYMNALWNVLMFQAWHQKWMS